MSLRRARFDNTPTNLVPIFDKAQAYAEARKIDAAALIDSRLYGDELPASATIVRPAQKKARARHKWECSIVISLLVEFTAAGADVGLEAEFLPVEQGNGTR